MGLRAVRFCFKYPEIFINQLKGILLAHKDFKNIKILFPMVSGLVEVEKLLEFINETKKELDYNENIDIGIMIEIPSSAIISDIVGKHVDFFSIGTNDLIQYTLAIDRLNDDVSYLYEPGHPAIVRLIKATIDGAKKNNIPVNVCGEMAGESIYVPVLLGLGIRRLSMNPVSIPQIKELIRNLDIRECKEIVKKVLTLEKSTLIKEFLYDTISKKVKNFEYYT